MFQGKVALVTGASSGIGSATAFAFAREGATVVLADIDKENGLSAAQSIEESGGIAAFFHADVTSSMDVQSAVNHAVDRFGRLDFAYNNAAIAPGLNETAGIEEDTWDRIIDVNLRGVWLCMKYELRQMRKQHHGAIVNAASALAHTGFSGLSPYCASKHGVIGLTQAAALEYAGSGIRINAVCPGLIRSPLVEKLIAPFPGMGTPEDVAGAVLWLCSSDSAYVNGESIFVRG